MLRLPEKQAGVERECGCSEKQVEYSAVGIGKEESMVANNEADCDSVRLDSALVAKLHLISTV